MSSVLNNLPDKDAPSCIDGSTTTDCFTASGRGNYLSVRLAAGANIGAVAVYPSADPRYRALLAPYEVWAGDYFGHASASRGAVYCGGASTLSSGAGPFMSSCGGVARQFVTLKAKGAARALTLSEIRVFREPSPPPSPPPPSPQPPPFPPPHPPPSPLPPVRSVELRSIDYPLVAGTNVINITISSSSKRHDLPCGFYLRSEVSRLVTHHTARFDRAASKAKVHFSPVPSGTILMTRQLATNGAGLATGITMPGDLIMLDNSPPVQMPQYACSTGAHASTPCA